ncbi:MAG: aminotransferase class III-fold pyridoxal phosphate-dependent enzyme [Aestuariivirga sp.]|uniref:aminotransferase class III-fold pyridoxal phosphate-dependent enzyme n=1 Tax=Aestuariivirga sp. TaxID=2650926 RepID=UPI0025BB7A9F|nr:aminotransferase class III-fold pyridoxal phosphate-dependent enzyme [Aestuariivirga sp.]MCA3559727.1 aminotransferase class III-fold pyridoxal phosphate-dependent enzyme [Aestuariivirga sp.]
MLDTLRPPALPLDLLQAFALEYYGLSGAWSALEGERDQNYRIKNSDGRSTVFKVCHPAEGDAVLQCQAAALEHIAAADPALTVPRLIRTRDGVLLGGLTHGASSYPIMALSWLEGRVLGGETLAREALFEMGQLLARLGLALRGFIHGAPAERDLVWDTRNIRRLAPEVGNLAPEDRALAAEILARHEAVTAPALRCMRAQIIHGDVHPHNVLVDAQGRVTGIIDFGDMVHGPLVLDLANAAGDFLTPDMNAAGTIFELVRGYRSVTPLEEAEADALVDLIEARLLMTPLVDALKASNGIASQDYFQAFNSRSMPMIRELRRIGHDEVRALIRRAAAFPGAPPQHPKTAEEAIARRRRVMGEKLYVFYDPPLHIVKGEGVWLTASDGRRYLDCYNNVPHVGHAHPYVAEAIARQARTLNTNTRYITDQALEYAERLTELAGEGLTAVTFVNSGSEANDLAWRMAKAFTGHTGGLCMDFAYHGVSEAIDAFSPSNAPAHWNAPHIRLLPAPDVYRGPYGAQDADVGECYAALAGPLIAELREKGFGVAAVMVDSAFMTNGILDAPAGYLQGIAGRVRQAGGLFIADEVQSGFGRMGPSFWGHRHHGVTPDFITIGKPAGNGYPLGAVITRPEILSHFLQFGPFFSTFGGNNVAGAAGMAVLDVIRDENLLENARDTGAYFRRGLSGLMQKHSLIGDVRGVGLATGVELVHNRASKAPAGGVMHRLLNLIRDEGALVGGEGKSGNVLKIRPPIVFSRADADFAVAAIGRAFARL